MCCLHFSFTPRKYPRWLQKQICPDQTASKQAAVSSGPKQLDQNFHKINTQVPDRQHLHSSPQGTPVQLLILGDQTASDIPFSGEAPHYRWQLKRSTLLNHTSANEYLPADVQLPSNSLCTALRTHVHCLNRGWEMHLAPALHKPCKA